MFELTDKHKALLQWIHDTNPKLDEIEDIELLKELFDQHCVVLISWDNRLGVRLIKLDQLGWLPAKREAE